MDAVDKNVTQLTDKKYIQLLSENSKSHSSTFIRLLSPHPICTDVQVSSKDKLMVYTATLKTLLDHMVFSKASFNIRTSLTPKRFEIVQPHVWLRAGCTMSNHTCCAKCHHSGAMSELGTLQSHFITCCYFIACPSLKLKESISWG